MKLSILTLLIFISYLLLAQDMQYKKINGFVYDNNTGESLIGASIYTHNGNGTITNNSGYFSLSIPSITDSINISYIGYRSQTLSIKNTDFMKIFLNSGIDIDEITVKSEFKERSEIGVNKIQIKKIKELPSLFGEIDIIKSFQLMPGVQSGGEGKSELYVRGGSPDQNLILLDNVPLYYVAHFGGFFSIFNADAINDVELFKGGFPARYGSRLSSVMDVTMREGNMNNYRVQGAIGLISTKISVEAPIIKQKSSFLISVRRNLLPIFSLMDTGLKYSFYDINAKGNYKISDKNRLYLSIYTGMDNVKTDQSDNDYSITKQNVKWGNIMGSIRWNKIWNNSIFSNLTLYNTIYSYKTHYSFSSDIDSVNRKYSNDLKSSVKDFGIKYDINHSINKNLKFQYGIQSIYHIFNPNDEKIEQSGFGVSTINEKYDSEINAVENAAYIESHINTVLLNLNLGIRYANFIQNNHSYNSIEPRLTASYDINESLTLSYGYSYMQQFIHLLSYSGSGLPSDYWMPTTSNIKPENSKQNTMGFSWLFLNNEIRFTTEAYYKTMDNLIAFKPGSSLSGNLTNWENLVELNGTGQNYGIEFFIQKTKGKTTGWSGLTLSKANRKFSNINNGEEYPFKYDRLIDFSIVISHKIKENISISGTWTYGSGYPVTLATETYQYEDKDVFVYDEKNSYNMRNYHRLDLAINFHKKTKKGERTWNISILNAYNRQNPYFYFYERDELTVQVESETGYSFESRKGELKLKQFSLFSFLPTFSYSFKF